MLRLKEIDHLVLRVRDFDSMENFYCDVLGCSLKRRRPGLVQLNAGASVIDLIAAKESALTSDRADHNLDHFCLSVLDFDLAGVAKHLESCGVTIGHVTGRGSIFLNDPEGNRVELIGADQHDGSP
jgi:glyoxylase I family protein